MFTLPTNNPMMKALFNTNMVKVVYSEDFQNKRRVYLPNTPSPYHNPIYSIWAVGVCAVRKFGFLNDNFTFFKMEDNHTFIKLEDNLT